MKFSLHPDQFQADQPDNDDQHQRMISWALKPGAPAGIQVAPAAYTLTN
jgi:hypothetical protein